MVKQLIPKPQPIQCTTCGAWYICKPEDPSDLCECPTCLLKQRKILRRQRAKENRKNRRRVIITFRPKGASMSYQKFTTTELVAARDLLSLAIEHRTKSMNGTTNSRVTSAPKSTLRKRISPSERLEGDPEYRAPKEPDSKEALSKKLIKANKKPMFKKSKAKIIISGPTPRILK